METFLGLTLMLPLFGLLTMTVMPRHWHTVSGWLMVSYLIIPGFIALIALVVSWPIMLFGVVFFLGIAAAKK